MQFKTLALVTTSLVAFGLASTTASAKMMGSVHLGTGHTWQDDNNGGPDNDDEFMNLFGGAQVNIPYSDTVNLQIDVLGDSAYANSDTDDNNFATAFTLGAHINHRDDGGYLGVFGATGRSSAIDENTTSFFAAGFEGAFFGANWIAGGQLGWLDSCCDDDPGADEQWLHDAGFIRAHGTWFANPGLSVGASVAYVDGEREPSPANDVRLWEWTVKAEKMVGANTSIFIEYRGMDAEESGADTDEVDSHTVSGGFRFHFDAMDLFAAATEGPSAETLRYGRWVAEAGEQLD